MVRRSSVAPLLAWLFALSVVEAQTTCTATVGPRPLELGIGVFVLGLFLAVWLVFWIVGCVVREQVLFLALGCFLFCAVFVWLLFSPRLPSCTEDVQPETYDWTSSIKLIRIMLGFMFALIIGLSGIGFVGYGLLRETNAENRSMRGTGRSVAVCRLCAGALRTKTTAAR